MTTFKKEIELYPYQQEYYKSTIDCLAKNKGVLLCLDTGMGKTYIGTRMIQDVIKTNPVSKILVLVRKKNLDDPWGNLFGKEKSLVTTGNKTVYFLYSKAEANKLRSNIISSTDFTDFNVILTNYDKLAANINDFISINWDLVIYDEVHDYGSKNKELKIFKILSNLNINKQVGLTASPMRNTIRELFVLHEFIQDNKNIIKAYKVMKEHISEFLKKSSADIKNYYYEQAKKEFSHYLSENSESNEKIKYNGPNADARNEMAEEYLEEVLTKEMKKHIGKTIFYHSKRDEKLPQLKPLVNRNIFLPLLFKQSAQFHLGIDHNTILRLWKTKAQMIETAPMASASKKEISYEYPQEGISTKEVFLMQLVKYIVETTNDKIVIFSEYTTTLAYFFRKLLRENYGCEYIEGSFKDYQDRIENFKKNKSKRIILVSLDSFKEGIDLRCANHVVFLDLPYNPQVLLQAKDRCHRTGQEKNVFVYYLIYQADFLAPDEIRMRYLAKKNARFNAMFDYDSDGNRLPEFIVENYKFSYEDQKNHSEDMMNNYNSLKSMLKYSFMTNEFTHQFDIYDTASVRDEGVSCRFGVSTKYSKVHCYDKEDLLASPYDDIDFSDSLLTGIE